MLTKQIKLLSTAFLCTIFTSVANAYDANHDMRFYGRIITFPHTQPIEKSSWYEPKEKVIGNNIELKYANKTEIKLSEQAREKITEYAQENKSLSLLILENDKIIHEKYFGTWTKDSAGDSESMAKSVLALLIGIAIKEGKIKSEYDQVSDYIEEWKNDDRKKIKIKDLLEMTSGLRNNNSLLNPTSDLAKLHLGFDVSEFALSIPAEKRAGRKFDYNNFNSQVLGILLSRATGKKYSDYLSEKLLKPLGVDDINLWLDHEHGTPRTYCCLFAKTKDWAKFGLLVLHKGFYNGKQIVPKEWIEKMIIPSKNRPAYGYHIWLAKSKSYKKARVAEPFLNENTIFFDGRSKQRVFIIPEKNIVVVRIGETSDSWTEDVIPNIIERDLQ